MLKQKITYLTVHKALNWIICLSLVYTKETPIDMQRVKVSLAGDEEIPNAD